MYIFVNSATQKRGAMRRGRDDTTYFAKFFVK